MMRAGRVIGTIALLLFASAVVLGAVPTRATAVEYSDTSEEVNCGSFGNRTSWSGDAGCDKARTARITWMLLLLLAAVPVGVVGGGLLLVGRRNGP